jgi:hypothetical protein
LTLSSVSRSFEKSWRPSGRPFNNLKLPLKRSNNSDIAIGRVVETSTGIDLIEDIMRKAGLSFETTQQGWEIMSKYKELFKVTAYLSVLIALNSHLGLVYSKTSAY